MSDSQPKPAWYARLKAKHDARTKLTIRLTFRQFILQWLDLPEAAHSDIEHFAFAVSEDVCFPGGWERRFDVFFDHYYNCPHFHRALRQRAKHPAHDVILVVRYSDALHKLWLLWLEFILSDAPTFAEYLPDSRRQYRGVNGVLPGA